ncbi:MAG: hypothetical protein J6Y80_07190 [Victivallales bacterium]|nr:hypothetical protein [Victivallales bacterium]
MLSTPAKVNLLLEVGELRPEDGRHEIRTLFLPVPQRADELEVLPNPPGSGLTLECTGREVPGGRTPSENLACRAVEAFCREFGIAADFHVRLHKRIPVSAGLGGGSSDAGAALLEMRRLTGHSMSVEDLVPLAARLGADVAFFLKPVPSLATGLGEILQPVEIAAAHEIVIVSPQSPSPVAWAYRNWRRPASLRPPAWPPAAEALSSIEGLASLVWNDLGFALEAKTPFLAMLRERLCQAGCLAAAVSGSGSSVFGLARPRQAQAIRAALRKAYPNLEVF